MTLLCTNCGTPDPHGMRAAEFTCAGCVRIENAARAIYHKIIPQGEYARGALYRIEAILSFEELAKAAINAVLGDLFVVIPREPSIHVTDEMATAYWNADTGDDRFNMVYVYRAMIAASEGGSR